MRKSARKRIRIKGLCPEHRGGRIFVGIMIVSTGESHTLVNQIITENDLRSDQLWIDFEGRDTEYVFDVRIIANHFLPLEVQKVMSDMHDDIDIRIEAIQDRSYTNDKWYDKKFESPIDNDMVDFDFIKELKRL